MNTKKFLGPLERHWKSIYNKGCVFLIDLRTEEWYLVNEAFFKSSLTWEKNIFPGSFNPIHEAHLEIRNTYKRNILHKQHYWFYEICIKPYGKDTLNLVDLVDRISYFPNEDYLIISNLSLFLEKAGFYSLGKSANFHVGYDTMDRLINHHGINGSNGVNGNFVLYTRNIDKKLYSLKNLREKYNFNDSNIIMEIEINNSISSTEIRKNKETV